MKGFFYHVKHFNSMSAGVSFTVEQAKRTGQSKSGGAMPPSLKSGGVTGPPAPGSAAYDVNFSIHVYKDKFVKSRIC